MCRKFFTVIKAWLKKNIFFRDSIKVEAIDVNEQKSAVDHELAVEQESAVDQESAVEQELIEDEQSADNTGECDHNTGDK